MYIKGNREELFPLNAQTTMGDQGAMITVYYVLRLVWLEHLEMKW